MHVHGNLDEGVAVMSDRMNGLTVVVTGGGSGIGAGIAKGMAREGANIAVADINLVAAQQVADEIVVAGGQRHCHACRCHRSRDRRGGYRGGC